MTTSAKGATKNGRIAALRSEFESNGRLRRANGDSRGATSRTEALTRARLKQKADGFDASSVLMGQVFEFESKTVEHS